MDYWKDDIDKLLSDTLADHKMQPPIEVKQLIFKSIFSKAWFLGTLSVVVGTGIATSVYLTQTVGQQELSQNENFTSEILVSQEKTEQTYQINYNDIGEQETIKTLSKEKHNAEKLTLHSLNNINHFIKHKTPVKNVPTNKQGAIEHANLRPSIRIPNNNNKSLVSHARYEQDKTDHSINNKLSLVSSLSKNGRTETQPEVFSKKGYYPLNTGFAKGKNTDLSLHSKTEEAKFQENYTIGTAETLDTVMSNHPDSNPKITADEPEYLPQDETSAEKHSKPEEKIEPETKTETFKWELNGMYNNALSGYQSPVQKTFFQGPFQNVFSETLDVSKFFDLSVNSKLHYKHWSLSVGAGLLKNTYLHVLDHQYSFPVEGIGFWDVVLVPGTGGGLPGDSATLDSVWVAGYEIVTVTDKFEQQHKVTSLQIPIQFGYNYRYKRFNFSVHSGVRFSLPLINRSIGSDVFLPGINTFGYRVEGVKVDVDVRAEVQYLITDQWGISLSPGFRREIRSNITPFNEGFGKPGQTNINAGLHFYFPQKEVK